MADKKKETYSQIKERCDMYHRQLGGTQAALNRARQREKDLEKLVVDIFNDFVSFCATEGQAYYPRSIYGKAFAERGMDVPLTVDEEFELNSDISGKMRQILVDLGMAR